MRSLELTAKVLRLLIFAEGPLETERISRELGQGPKLAARAIEELRRLGFVIESQSGKGYSLKSEPGQVLPVRMLARLEPGAMGLPYHYYPKLDSSNLKARQLALAGEAHGACVCTDYQTAGRGRLGRQWRAPAGACLLFSPIFRPDINIDMVFGITNITALATCLALEEICGVNPRIKWPNDLYLGGVKLAGILTEFTAKRDRVQFVIPGTGINVNLGPEELNLLPAPAASIMAATGRKWDRAEILAGIMSQLGRLYPMFMGCDAAKLASLYKARSMTIGNPITVRDGDKVISGLALGVAADGALILQKVSGDIVHITHGDVTVLKNQAG
jgi:BirA family biotin operon repressor/biotin-[acetyl-CoA-carboxylase] ligase